MIFFKNKASDLYHFASSNATSGPGRLSIPSAERQRNSGAPLSRSAELNLTNGFIRQLTSVRARDTCHAWPRSPDGGRWEYTIPTEFRKSRRRSVVVRPRSDAWPSRVETTPFEIFMTENFSGWYRRDCTALHHDRKKFQHRSLSFGS